MDLDFGMGVRYGFVDLGTGSAYLPMTLVLVGLSATRLEGRTTWNISLPKTKSLLPFYGLWHTHLEVRPSKLEFSLLCERG